MHLLLNILYLGLIVAVSPYLVWAAFFHGKYREGFAAKFLGKVKIRQGDKTCIWLHAVSVGEVNLLQTLIDQLRVQYSDVEFYITTTTKTGHTLACKKYSDCTVDYCPLDFSWAVNNAYRRIRPNMVILAELELWPNLIRSAHQFDATICVVNGRLSEKSFRGYQRLSFLMRPLLQQLDLIAVQDPVYAERFQNLGAKNVEVTGSLKFDGAETSRNNPFTVKLKKLAQLSDTDVVFLAGSTQSGEEEAALETFSALTQQHPELRLILVPRHPERFDEVAQLLDQSPHAWQRRSNLEADGPDLNSKILLVDTIGELGAWWGTAQIAFVGGSLGTRGGQNMIEPSAYGGAVCFGPKTRNFRDVVQLLLSHDAAVVVQDSNELKVFVENCLESVRFRQDLGNKAAQIVLTQLGATKKTVDLLQKHLPMRDLSRKAA
ncbi:MAG: 3-deoxy-D-manno-octulosonic acid transferase [Blastopirellula sp.]|nr:MAG: 3-deoxy-D-manno-octulosonic acid transferase [Blastopirellula sp.]